MRFFDIALAILVGTSAIAGTALWTPRAGDAKSSSLALRAELRDRLAGFIDAKGMWWFLDTPAESVCAYLGAHSNATLALGGAVGPVSCGRPPQQGAVTASISFRIASREVTLEAWSDAAR